MKKSTCFILAASTCLLLNSCKHEEKIIEKVAYNYSYAMANYDLESAAKYATEETKNTTLRKADYLVKAVGEKYIESDTPASIEIIKLEKVNDTTAYVVYHKKTPQKDFSARLYLLKRDGQWLAHKPIKEIPGNSSKEEEINFVEPK